jgi:hypothetical protein
MLHGKWAVHFPKTKTILLTQHDERQYIREALETEVPWRTIPFQRPPCREAGRLHVGNTCPEGQWTVFAEAFDDDSMGTTSPTHRRSGRAFHRMRVEAHGRAHNGKKFKEACETVVVNAHGGLLMLKHEIDNGEMIVLTNPETLEEQECRVVYQGEPCEKGQRIGVEFLTPAPRFWGLEFGELSTPAGGGDATAVH